MANTNGYATIKTDRPGLFLAGGKVTISDGYGTPDFSNVPSAIVRSVVLNSTGNYSIILQQQWPALVSASVQTIVPTGGSDKVLLAQIQEITVGDVSVLPVQDDGDGQSVTFQVFDLSGVETQLPEDAGFVFSLELQGVQVS